MAPDYHKKEASPQGQDSTLHVQDDSRTLHGLRVFHEVARAITTARDRDSIIRAVINQMEPHFRPRSWSLLLVEEAEKTLHYAVREGYACARNDTVRIPLGEGMAGWVAMHGETLIVPHIQALSAATMLAEKPGRFSEAELSGLTFKPESAISLPLRSRGCTLGVLQLLNYRLEALTDYTMAFLHVLVDYAGIAIENAQVIERIQELTILDDATRLFNARHLQASLHSEFERSKRFHSMFSVIFMDLDFFKSINDQYGHLVGTELLVEVAQLIQKVTRSVDSVFRYGGDEFVVLLPMTSKEAAVDVAQRLRESLRCFVFLEKRSLRIRMTASFGISTYPLDGSDAQAVLQAADTMMYSVKKSTRDSIAFNL